MPIDSRIPLGGNPIAIPAPPPLQQTNPLQTLQTLSTIEDVRAQVEQRRALAEATRQKAMEQGIAQQAFTESAGDVPKAVTLMRQRGALNAAAAVEEKYQAAEKDRIAGVKSDLEIQGLRRTHALNLVNYITDQASQDRVLPLIAKDSPEVASLIPPTYHAPTVKRVADQLLTAAERAAHENDFVKLWTDNKPMEAVATLYGNAKTDEDVARATAIARAWHAPEELIAQLGGDQPYAPDRASGALAIARGQKPPTEAELAVQAAGGDALATKAMGILKPGPKTEIPHVGSFEDYVDRAAKEQGKDAAQLTTKDIEKLRESYRLDQRPSVTVNTGTTAVPGNFNVTGESFLDTIPPQWRATVKKIANYDEDPTKVTSMRGGMRETVMQWVNQVNPAYDASQFANRAPTRKAFTTGTQGRQITNINTALGHLDQLTTLADQLQSGGFVPGNRAWNAIRTAFGADQVTNFDTLKDALAGEVAGVLSQSGATVSGIADAQNKIHASSSPQQLAGYVKTLIPVMGSKLASLDYQYHQAMGADDTFSALSPESKRILQSHGFDPDHPTLGGTTQTGVSVTAPNGKTYTFDTAAQAAAFKKRAGIP